MKLPTLPAASLLGDMVAFDVAGVLPDASAADEPAAPAGFAAMLEQVAPPAALPRTPTAPLKRLQAETPELDVSGSTALPELSLKAPELTADLSGLAETSARGLAERLSAPPGQGAPLEAVVAADASSESEPSKPLSPSISAPAEPAILRDAALVAQQPLESAARVGTGVLPEAAARIQRVAQGQDEASSKAEPEAAAEPSPSPAPSAPGAGAFSLEGMTPIEPVVLPVSEAAPLSTPEPLSQVTPESLEQHTPQPGAHALPGEDALLRFQKLTHDQLSLRVEDADGSMDVELTREQAALQVKIVAPVDVIPELLGLSGAVENALASIGLQLDSYTAFAHEDKPEISEQEGEGSDDADGGEPERDAHETAADRLLDLIV